MGRESDSGAALTGARGGGTIAGRSRCVRGAAVRGGEGEHKGRRGFFGRSAWENGEKIPHSPYFNSNIFGSSHSETVVNKNRL